MQELHYVKSFITAYGMWRTSAQRNSLEIFFTVFHKIIAQEFVITPFRVTVSTEIPMCAGLGSSTSFTVCLTTCFVYWHNLRGVYDLNAVEPFYEEIEMIASIVESTVQNNEFVKADVKVCIYGKILKCQLSNYLLDVENMVSDIYIETMKILLIDSNNRQTKHSQVKKMILKSESFDDLHFILHKLNFNAEKMLKYFELITTAIGLNDRIQQQNCYNKLKKYVRKIQVLLTEHDLSSEAFDNIARTATTMEYAAKLTGFGSRYAYILLPPYLRDHEINTIMTRFQDENFTVTKTTINCEGVRVDN